VKPFKRSFAKTPKMTDAEAHTGIAAAGSIKEMGMRKILFEKWDKEAAAGELQKNPDILTKIYLGVCPFDRIFAFDSVLSR
jgi:hypothetical protein